MEREAALAHIVNFIEHHNTCALATGAGDYVRCTPIEYTFMDGEFYLYSEGGDKFLGLEKNKNVSLAIFEYYGDRNNSHGLQIMGEATLYPPRCELFKKVLAFKGIPYDVMKAAKVDVALIRITPKVYEMYDTDFVKAGYDVRQIVRF
ncbi:MAG: pyridoxamine 5'-phosphate oxidase family protein [Clostridia bacterium]|nr:pyridoxamine 5'-phosphate oxidase family protein [Clostridia bacterium]